MRSIMLKKAVIISIIYNLISPNHKCFYTFDVVCQRSGPKLYWHQIVTACQTTMIKCSWERPHSKRQWTALPSLLGWNDLSGPAPQDDACTNRWSHSWPALLSAETASGRGHSHHHHDDQIKSPAHNPDLSSVTGDSESREGIQTAWPLHRRLACACPKSWI